jgi:uncharacterized DUF497 family protein
MCFTQVVHSRPVINRGEKPMQVSYRASARIICRDGGIIAGRLPIAKVTLSHTDRGENVRLISARKASRGERKHYEENK